MTNTVRRNSRIDYLRSLAILLVMLAHVSPPEWMMQIRTFDVVLLFILSGGGISLSAKTHLATPQSKSSFFGIVWRRSRKLILPAYAVTIGYWLVVQLVCLFLHRELAYSFSQLLYALAFTTRGLGFIWIAVIFLWGTLLGQAFRWLSNCIRSDALFTLLLGGLLLFVQLLWFINQSLAAHNAPVWLQIIFNDWFGNWLAYLLMTFAGVRLLERQEFKYWLLGIGIVLFLFFLWQIGSFCPNNFKYPPNLYYIGYGLSISMLLWLATPNIHIKGIEWFSRHSWDIYLAHIVLYVLTVFVRQWLFRYAIIATGSVIIVIIWELLSRKCVRHKAQGVIA